MRYSVLTYIFGGYEPVHEVARKEDDVEYILVTDDKSLTSRTWNVVYDESLEGMSVFDKCYKVRFCPFDYCRTNTVVRIDGSMTIKDGIGHIVDTFIEGGYDMALMIHPERDNIIDEYNTWARDRNYDATQAMKCIGFMQRSGYDFNYKGLFQFGFAIQGKNKVSMAANSITYEIMKYLGNDGIERIDQTVFTFVMNTLFKDAKIMPVSEKLITASKYIQWCYHGTFDPIPNKDYKTAPYMYDKPCTTEF